jgi:hypothetical protein
MEQPRDRLTDAQREYLRPSIAKISEGFAELREKLVELGWDEGDFSCRLCDCEFFVSEEGPPSLRCARPTCGHGFTSHNVF